MPYRVYKGKLDAAHIVIEAWLQRHKHTRAMMSSLSRCVDYRCQKAADAFNTLPDIQWDGPCRLRIALWDAADTAAFITKVAPHMITAGYSMTDERTGAWIDEREIMSVQSGLFVYSVASTASLQALGNNVEPVVLVDMPDHLLKLDVEGLVRQALTAKGVAQVDSCPLVAKRLDWTMGNVRLPSWQVSGPSGLASALLGSMLDIDVPGPGGRVASSAGLLSEGIYDSPGRLV